MRLAFFSDLHANLAASQAAVQDAVRRGADRLYCAGDLIGYGPNPNEVIGFVERRMHRCISGNYDTKVLGALRAPDKYAARMKKHKWRILNWTARALSRKSIRFLNQLPETWSEELLGGVRLLMVHGSPLDPDDTILPSLTAIALRTKLGLTGADLLVCGHTHIPFVRRIRGVLVVNCGSVGQPVDGDPRGAYALVELFKAVPPRARIVRFAYPLEEVQQALIETPLPERLVRDLEGGIKQKD